MSTLKLISWNVNGLRACMQKGFLDFFDTVNADIVCLQETKLQEGQIQWPREDYHAYWNYAEKKGYSGTAVFSREEPLSVTRGIGIEEHDHEGRVLTLEYPSFYLVNVYTPNSQRELTRLEYRMQWEDAFRAYLNGLRQHKPVAVCGDMKDAHPSSTPISRPKPIIICGDLNVAASALDLKHPKSNVKNAGFTPEERSKFQSLLDSGYVDSFRALHPDEQKFSWWSYMRNARANNAGWRIDYFLVSDSASDQIQSADILTDVMGSDHAPVSLQIDV